MKYEIDFPESEAQKIETVLGRMGIPSLKIFIVRSIRAAALRLDNAMRTEKTDVVEFIGEYFIKDNKYFMVYNSAWRMFKYIKNNHKISKKKFTGHLLELGYILGREYVDNRQIRVIRGLRKIIKDE